MGEQLHERVDDNPMRIEYCRYFEPTDNNLPTNKVLSMGSNYQQDPHWVVHTHWAAPPLFDTKLVPPYTIDCAPRSVVSFMLTLYCIPRSRWM
eukprot:1514212-Pyramimonas_sp.AAC.1